MDNPSVADKLRLRREAKTSELLPHVRVRLLMSKSQQARALSAELERAALRALVDSWGDLNATFFRRSLRRPVFALSEAPGRLGRWVPEQRTIEISRRLLTDHGWGAVVEVLKHEIAHQFVDEALGLRGEAAHGPAFRAVCAERGFDPAASGVPEANASAGHEKVLERVAKLLALAESPNVHEAQAAMNAAQRLMLKYNLQTGASGRPSAYGFRHLGRATGRVSESERILAAIIGEHFFVQAIWVPVYRPLEAKRGSVLEICGSPENLELADYVHSFLMHTAERLWRDYKKDRKIQQNAKRRTFLAGVMSGFRDKLNAQRRGDSAQGLVWVGDRALDGFFRKRHPRVRFTQYSGGRRSDAYAHGREAGSRIVLHRGVSAGSSGGTRLLPG